MDRLTCLPKAAAALSAGHAGLDQSDRPADLGRVVIRSSLVTAREVPLTIGPLPRPAPLTRSRCARRPVRAVGSTIGPSYVTTASGRRALDRLTRRAGWHRCDRDETRRPRKPGLGRTRSELHRPARGPPRVRSPFRCSSANASIHQVTTVTRRPADRQRRTGRLVPLHHLRPARVTRTASGAGTPRSPGSRGLTAHPLEVRHDHALRDSSSGADSTTRTSSTGGPGRTSRRISRAWATCSGAV